MTTADAGGAPAGPFTRPGFIASALVVALVLVLGAVLGILRTAREEAAPPAGASTGDPVPAATASTPGPEGAGASVCGLGGEALGPARLDAAPQVDRWDYQGTTAYPVSQVYGPAATSAEGYRYCFQRSAEGALLAAAGALATGTDEALARTWIEYFLAPGPYREQLLGEAPARASGAAPEGSARLRIIGFRLLSYTGDRASVDLAVWASTQGREITLSMVYHLQWSDGDWRLSSASPAPLDVVTIPDAAGYVSWGS
ncbi:hypothetical protein [Actinomyces bowdenii]|uniref:DUF8175 domain-containing protein n=1 Tax=Actinomyces bowdenii TaxID=131109 RepID=A0A3P1V481_9ACTO|nr:hypothetical protein [Actinomyces bowdenii]RRD28999.1 hypothetical protein EII10_07860 [Actinomyces bowdenii]